MKRIGVTGNWNPPFLYWQQGAEAAGRSPRIPLFWVLEEMVRGHITQRVWLGVSFGVLLLLVMVTGVTLAGRDAQMKKKMETLEIKAVARVFVAPNARPRRSPLLPPLAKQPLKINPQPKHVADEPLADGIHVAGIQLRVSGDRAQQLPAVVADQGGYVAYVQANSAYADRVFQREGKRWSPISEELELENFWCLILPHPNGWDELRTLLSAEAPRPGAEVWILLPGRFLEEVRSRVNKEAKARAIEARLAEIKLDSSTRDGFVVVGVR